MIPFCRLCIMSPIMSRNVEGPVTKAVVILRNSTIFGPVYSQVN